MNRREGTSDTNSVGYGNQSKKGVRGAKMFCAGCILLMALSY